MMGLRRMHTDDWGNALLCKILAVAVPSAATLCRTLSEIAALFPRHSAQTLVLVEKTPEGDVVESPGIDVRFMPLTSTKEQLEPSGHTD